MLNSVCYKKIDENIFKGIDHIIKKCGKINTQDKVLILFDEKTQSLANLFELRSAKVSKKVISLLVKGINRHGQEPDFEIANEMLNSSLIFSLCTWSLAHTNARIKAATAGARFLSLPNYSIDFITNPAIFCDYESIAPRCSKVANFLTKGSILEIKTDLGTNLIVNIKDRIANYCPGFVEKPGELGSPPDIEANISPQEKLSQGKVFIDGSITCEEIGLLKENVSLDIRDGRIKNIDCTDITLRNKLNEIMGDKNSKRRVLAEFGIGLNPLAKLTGIMLTDEGALGTIHLGFGSNITVGGQNKVDFHLDFVIKKPTVILDKNTIIQKGHLII